MSTAVQIQNLSFAYGSKPALHDVSLDMPARKVTAFIGPSGCGKSTLIRCINRINDRIAIAHVTAGTIKVHGIDIYRNDINIQELRRRVGAYLDRLGVPYLLTARGNRVAAMWQVHNPRREAERLLQALPPGSRLGYSAVHAGGEPDHGTGAVAPPIHLTTTFAHGPAGERVAGYEYQREGNPTQDRLEQMLEG